MQPPASRFVSMATRRARSYIRPLIEATSRCAAGRYGYLRNRSKSRWRALCPSPNHGFPGPSCSTVCPYCLYALLSDCNNPAYRLLVVNPRRPESRDGSGVLPGIVRMPVRPALQAAAAMFSCRTSAPVLRCPGRILMLQRPECRQPGYSVGADNLPF